jgi:hypothetical protein
VQDDSASPPQLVSSTGIVSIPVLEYAHNKPMNVLAPSISPHTIVCDVLVALNAGLILLLKELMCRTLATDSPTHNTASKEVSIVDTVHVINSRSGTSIGDYFPASLFKL